MTSPPLNICQYRVKPGKEAEMEALLAKHWPALHAAGLVDDTPAVVYRGLPDPHHGAARCYVEMFSWKTSDGPQLAHQNPEVMAVWGPMGEICEHMEFPSYERLDLA